MAAAIAGPARRRGCGSAARPTRALVVPVSMAAAAAAVAVAVSVFAVADLNARQRGLSMRASWRPLDGFEVPLSPGIASPVRGWGPPRTRRRRSSEARRARSPSVPNLRRRDGHPRRHHCRCAWAPPPPAGPPPPPPPSASVAEASWPEAALNGAAVAPPPPPDEGLAGLSSRLPPLEETPAADGQTLNDTTPITVTKTIAAPASRPPEAPTPTMRLSDVRLAA